MSEATDIEKKSLEAHVELCAERYNQLEQQFAHVETRIDGLQTLMREVHDMVARLNEKRNDQLISWGLGIIGSLVAATVYLVITYVIK
jgi:chaperonin cofactor prefoldin